LLKVVVEVVVVAVVDFTFFDNTMESSTGTTPNKRTRFDPSASDGTSITGKSSKSPMAAATSHVQAHVASLQPPIATILSRLAKQYLLLLSKLYHKTKQLETLKDDLSFVPRSARINFELSASKKAKLDAEFPALRDKCTQIIDETTTSLKNQIVLVTDLEIKILRNDVRELFANSLQVITKAFLIADGHSETILPERMVNTLLDRYHETLLPQYLLCSLAQFRKIYSDLHNLASLPDPYPTSQPAAAAEDTAPSQSLFLSVAEQNAIRNSARAPAPRTTEDTVASTLKRTLESIFITSWKLYLRQSETNSIDLALNKLSIEHFDSKATEAAVMEIDMEPPATRQHLDGLIRASVSKQTKKLQAEIQSLKAGLAKQTAPKNAGRGSASASASLKKKSPGTAPKADAPADASSNAKERTNSRKSTQRSSGKKKNSTRQKKTAAPRSSNAST
jgi:hypothetical protein